MTVAELKKIWEPARAGQDHASWNQVDPAWPDEPLKLFGAGADSGTFDYFTEAIVGKAKASRGDYTASEDDNVLVQGVAQRQERARLLRLRLLRREQGQAEGRADRRREGKAGRRRRRETVAERHLHSRSSRPIFIYVNAKSLDKPEVKEFVEFYLKNGAKLVQRSEVRAAARRRPTRSAWSTCSKRQAGHRVRRRDPRSG